MLEETKEGLNIEIVDQDGRSMFPDAAKEPFEHTRKLIQKIAPQLKAMPYRLSIVGHTLQARCRLSPAMGLGNCLPIVRTPYARFWMRRVCRQGTSIWWPARPILIRFFRTTLTCRNRRVTITLMREEPPLPDNLTP
jgi:chemotaxis protein MotB